MQRELQLVRDEAKAAVVSRERLSQELQTKQAQVCSLEGQLDAARTLNNKLSLEVKRLEPSKSSSNLYQTVFFLILFSVSLSGWRQNWRSCRTAVGQQMQLHFLHRAGAPPLPGNTVVQSCKPCPSVCHVYSFCSFVLYLITSAEVSLESYTKKKKMQGLK